MIKLGVTGGIGSGKSVVCKTLSTLGIPVFDSDGEVKKIYNTSTEVKEQVIALWGEQLYNNNVLNTKKLASIVFSNANSLHQLNKIVHPAVQKRFQEWAHLQDTPYVIEESAIIFESGGNKFLDKIATINSPVELRIERVMLRNGWSKEEVEQRMEQQMSDEERSSLADYTLINDNNTALLPQILKLHEAMLQLVK